MSWRFDVAQAGSRKMLFIPFIRDEVILAVNLDTGVIQVDWDNDS